MKRKLLKPPPEHGGIIFLPQPGGFLKQIKQDSLIGTAHQPYFFNPGVSLRFIFLQSLAQGRKRIIFLDTDSVRLSARLPWYPQQADIVLLNTDTVLAGYPMPEKAEIEGFFIALERAVREYPAMLDNLLNFKNIFLKNSRSGLLKEALAESFRQYYGIGGEYCFLSDLIKGGEFREFFRRICQDNVKFQQVFNTALDDYRKEFRFRYKNFPFPKLMDNELPFWVVRNNKRIRCFKGDFGSSEMIFPRAVTLTIFLRLYKTELFIHGIGGANYEWVQDRVIKGFFKQSPPDYAVISGTFLIKGFKERGLPYFLYSPQEIKEKACALAG